MKTRMKTGYENAYETVSLFMRVFIPPLYVHTHIYIYIYIKNKKYI